MSSAPETTLALGTEADAAARALLRFASEGAETHDSYEAADVSPGALDQMLPAGVQRSAGAGLEMRGRGLAGVNLRTANLSYADLREADLSRVRANGILLRGAQLEGAQFEGGDLVGADLSDVSAGEASFAEAMLEDARLVKAQLRFANFSESVLEGADLTEADLWGAKLNRSAADRANFRGARLDESSLVEAELPGADLSEATLRRADLSGAHLERANLREAVLDGANLAGADLSGASLPNLSLAGCDLTGVFFAGSWLERTRMRAHQLGGHVGEEATGNLSGAIDSYVVLERNFVSLGLSDDASWAYLRKRRVGRRLHRVNAKAHWDLRERKAAMLAALLWVADTIAEWLCDYGESLVRVARSFVCILIGFAVVYWLTGSLKAREGFSAAHMWAPVNYLLFSLDSMTTVGTSEVALRPSGELGILLSSLQTVIGTILLGLFGFVLGARIRS